MESYAVLYSFTEKALQDGEEGVEQSESESVEQSESEKCKISQQNLKG